MTSKGLRKRKQNISRFLSRYTAILKIQTNRIFESAQNQGNSVPL